MRRAWKRAGFLAALALAATLAGCDEPRAPAEVKPPASRPAAAAFRHDIAEDLSGTYRPVGEVAVGDYRLAQLFLGQARDFAAWEEGSGGGAPVTLEFARADGSGRVGVGPTSYSVTDGAVRFAGESAELGPVRFEGRLDQGTLATARRNLGEEAPALRGTLNAGGQSRTVALAWYGGD